MTPIYLPHGVTEGPLYGTQEWNTARRGRVTASRFADIMAEPRSKAAKEAGLMGESARGYLMEVVFATISGRDKVGGKSAAMDRGIDLEADAIDAYALRRFGEDIGKGRLLLRDDSLVAATPDGFVEDDEEGPGLLEVKCPEEKKHLETFLNRQLPDQYFYQVQGQLWVAGRRWCDFVSYDDRFPLPMRLVVIRVYRDEDEIEKLAAKVEAFSLQVEAKVDEVRAFLASCAPEQVEVIHNALQEELHDVTLPPEG